METPRVYRNKRELIRDCVHATDTVLDVGFLGQGMTEANDRWPHAELKKVAGTVYGVDLAIDREQFADTHLYQEASAESFSFPGVRFQVVFAGDLIEHLPNPGLFLARVAEHVTPDGVLVLTTPNCFNLFNLAEKLTKKEPTVNADHTCYFNYKTLTVLLQKSGFEVLRIGYVYSLEYTHTESFKKKCLNVLYALLSRFTTKYLETLVVVARPTTAPQH